MSDHILVEQDGAIATVVFNRPKMRNAISLAMWTEIAGGDRGAGQGRRRPRHRLPRGGDGGVRLGRRHLGVRGEPEGHRDRAAPTASRPRRPTRAIRLCPKPTVAMIFGFCMGGAMAIAMACDLRFAAAGSKFGIPAARLSIIYGLDAVHQLVDLVGPAYAKDILYSARALEAAEALAHRLHPAPLPAAELEAYTYDYLRTVADNAPAVHSRHQGPGPGDLRRASPRRTASSSRPWASRPSRARTTRKARARSSRSGRPVFKGR